MTALSSPKMSRVCVLYLDFCFGNFKRKLLIGNNTGTTELPCGKSGEPALTYRVGMALFNKFGVLEIDFSFFSFFFIQALCRLIIFIQLSGR